MNFWERTAPTENGCIEWQGPFDRHGYGRASQGRLAHRIAYTLAKGDPTGMIVCHSCDNPRCVNPAHLWLGSQRDNVRDMSEKRRGRGQSATHCVHGHEFTPENTYIRANGYRARQCRRCNAEAARRMNLRKAAA